MPAIYAHHTFGKLVLKELQDEELKGIIHEFLTQFRIGLQGPDPFFYYRPYKKTEIVEMGYQIHKKTADHFFYPAMDVIRRVGRRSKEYAYLLGFLCHYMLDSECHAYVAEVIETTGVKHLEVEKEFEKFLMRKDGKNPMDVRLAALIPTDLKTAEAMAPFYENATDEIARKALEDMNRYHKLLYAPGRGRQILFNMLFHLSGKYDETKGLMIQPVDNAKCEASNEVLWEHFTKAVTPAANLLIQLDDDIVNEKELQERFLRNFE